jgi:hypothetical protein
MLPARRTAAHQTVAVASSSIGGRAVLGAAVDGNTAAETYLVLSISPHSASRWSYVHRTRLASVP